MDNLEIYKSLSVPPEWAKKKISGGDMKGMIDISPQWRIQAMTEKFGVIGIGWYYEVVNKWLEKSADTICCFVEINLFIKNGEDWSKPIYGVGGNQFSYKTNKEYIKVSDECYKMATTDALSVSMKQLGVGASIYSGFTDSKYANRIFEKPKPQEKSIADLASEIVSLCKDNPERDHIIEMCKAKKESKEFTREFALQILKSLKNDS